MAICISRLFTLNPTINPTSMRCTNRVQSALLPLKSVRLGRFVLNIESPQQDFRDPPIAPPETTITPQHNFKEIQTSARASNLRVRLTQLLSASYGDQYSGHLDLSAAHARTYLLCNSRSWFSDACGVVEIREWLESAIEDGYDVYLVAGFHTVTDGHFAAGVVSSETSGGGVAVQIGALAGGITAAPAVVDLTTGIDSTWQAGTKHRRTFDAPGEQIYAVQYRKVQFKWYSSRKIDNGFLEQNNRWKLYWALRGDDDGEDDVVEANLADDSGLEESESDEIYISEDGASEFYL